MEFNRVVWYSHPIEGYKLGKLIDIGVENFTIEDLCSPETVVSFPLQYFWKFYPIFLTEILLNLILENFSRLKLVLLQIFSNFSECSTSV